MKQVINLHSLNKNCGEISNIHLTTINKNNPVILIIPGGAYIYTSTREDEPVANRFNSFGYNTCVLHYSCAPLCYPYCFNEAVESVKYLKKKFKHVFVMGFSAGGHLAGLLGTSKYDKLLSGMILCYPVVSFIKRFHKDSRTCFFNKKVNYNTYKEFSNEKRVTKTTAPTFIWCTKTDQAVNYKNTLTFVKALKRNKVYYEYKLFNNGRHGLALADKTTMKGNDTSYLNKEVSIWPTLADKFIKKIILNKKGSN